MATAWSAYLPWINPSVPGCPAPIAERAVCDAAIEFCELTQAFRAQVALATVAGTAVYAVTAPSGLPAMILGVKLGTRDIPAVHAEVLTRSLGETWRDDTGAPQCFVADDETTLHFYPNPTAAETGTVTLALRPARDATEWDDRLYQRYAEIVSYGALSRLHDQVSAPWSDPQVAVLRRQLFLRGINKVRAKSLAGYTPAAPYVAFSQEV